MRSVLARCSAWTDAGVPHACRLSVHHLVSKSLVFITSTAVSHTTTSGTRSYQGNTAFVQHRRLRFHHHRRSIGLTVSRYFPRRRRQACRSIWSACLVFIRSEVIKGELHSQRRRSWQYLVVSPCDVQEGSRRCRHAPVASLASRCYTRLPLLTGSVSLSPCRRIRLSLVSPPSKLE